jgi:hypothetical protein
VAATMRAVPVIIPVTFTASGDDVVFSPGCGEGLAHAVADSVIAFETDRVGVDGRVLWEVHVTGVARRVTSDVTASEFRLSSEIVSGWRSGD